MDIEKQNSETTNIAAFVERAKRYTEVKELTPSIVNEFIFGIVISGKQVVDGKTVYPIDVYYNGLGIIKAPAAEEYEEMFQEQREPTLEKAKDGIAVILHPLASLCEGG